MDNLWSWAGRALAVVGLLALGFWLGTERGVMASSSQSDGMGVQFQLDGIKPESALLVYQPEKKTVYVYQAATTGNANVQCSYKFQLTRPGEVIRRVACPVPEVNP